MYFTFGAKFWIAIVCLILGILALTLLRKLFAWMTIVGAILILVGLVVLGFWIYGCVKAEKPQSSTT